MYDLKYYVLFPQQYVIAVVSIYMSFLEVPPIMIRNLYFS